MSKNSPNPFENPLACYQRVLDIDDYHETAGNAFLKLYGEFFGDDVDSADVRFSRQAAELVRFVPVYSRASKLADEGRLNEALKEIKTVVAIKPTYSPGHLLKASILQRMGRVQQALDVYKSVLERKPENEEALEGIEQCQKILSAENAKGVL